MTIFLISQAVWFAMRASVVFALAKIYHEGIAQSLVTQEHSLKVCNDFLRICQ
jgi:hypothetical protein